MEWNRSGRTGEKTWLGLVVTDMSDTSCVVLWSDDVTQETFLSPENFVNLCDPWQGHPRD